MNTNRHLLAQLFATNQINLIRSPLFDTSPVALPADLDFDYVEGMLLGLAIGDALGNASEGMTWQQRRARYGEVRNYLFQAHHEETTRGYPSDDTQLAFWTLEQLLADGGFKPERVAARFTAQPIFGIGAAVSQFLHHYKHERKPWYQCGPESAGNGALMRIAPMLLPHLTTATPDLWGDTALSAMLTHNDAASTAACLAFVYMYWHLLPMRTPPEPLWWLKTYVAVARYLEGERTYRPRGGAFADYSGPIWRFVETYVSAAYRRNLPVEQACDSWFSGAYLLETLPCVIYILMRHGDNLEEAMVRAVNDTRDNDTIAAVVGAAMGALHGKQAIPQHWITHLSGRTTYQDDGRVGELIAAARATWWDRSERRAIPSLIRPIDGCYWVRPGQLLAGEYPYRQNEWQARHNLRLFLGVGITFFLDLTEEGEAEAYVALLHEEASTSGMAVVHRRMPIRDFGVATPHEMAAILDTIDAALQENHRVYVHCWFGTGRTGTVVGCHLVRHGMSGAQALAEIARLLAGTSKSDSPSPVTEEQHKMVLEWHTLDPSAPPAQG
jgi:ADP-ribosylglycohydrolase/protein-tyrosine phosphatase